MIFVSLLIPVFMLGCGFIMYKVPSKKFYRFLGYSTKLSRKNADTWGFANRYCGMLWIALGIISLFITGITAVILTIKNCEINPTAFSIIEMAEVAILLISIIPVEIKLHHTFYNNGLRR